MILPIKKNNFFIKLSLSYLILFLLPIFILIFLYTTYFTDFFRTNIIHNHLTQLQLINTEMEANTNRMASTVFQISYDSTFMNNLKKNTQYNDYKNMHILLTHNTSNPFVDNIFVYNKYNQVFIGTSSIYSISEFNKDFYQFECWEQNDFLHTFQNFNTPVVKASQNIHISYNTDKKMVPFLYPMAHKNKKNTQGGVLFLVNENKFTNIIKKHLPSSDEMLLITTKAHDPIITFAPDNFISAEGKTILLKEVNNKSNSEGHFNITLKKEEYLVTYLNTNSHFNYIRLFPLTSLKTELKEINKKFMLLVIVTLIVGIYFLNLFIKKNYQPVKKIAKYIRPDGMGDEIKTINEGVLTLQYENETLHQKLKSSQHALSNYFFHQLIIGNFSTREEVNQIGRHFNVHFPFEYFTICIFSTESLLHKNLRDSIIKKNINSFSKELIFYFKEHDDVSKLIIVLNHRTIKFDKLHEGLNQIKLYLTSQNIYGTYGVSYSSNKPSELPTLYSQCCRALDYQFITGQNGILYYFDEDKIENKDKLSLIKLLEEINRSLKNDDLNKSKEHLHQFITELKLGKKSIFLVRSLSYSLINILIKYLYEVHPVNQILEEDVYHLLDFSMCKNIDEFEMKILDFLDHLPNPNNPKAEQIHKHLLHYVHKNCYDYTFSSNKMSQHFNMSPSSLSQYFKHITGLTLSAYVHQLRINKAKELLSTTNIPVKDIVLQVGYVDNSSFTRKFKQNTGVTPGKYRKIY